jgi:hypothetical protein
MNQRTRMLREVAFIADRDDFRAKAEELGSIAAKALTRKKRSQITGLETLSESTQRVTDLFNYIKTRTARQKEWQQQNFGVELLYYLANNLCERRNDIVARFAAQQQPLDDYQQQEVYLLLLQAFIDQLAAHYEYACMLNEPAKEATQ